MNLILKNIPKTGLSQKEWEEILKFCARFASIDRVVVFGSRAQANFSKGSDVDLALFGYNILHEEFLSLAGLLNEESKLPYQFDLVDYQKIERMELKQHIDQVGLELLKRNSKK